MMTWARFAFFLTLCAASPAWCVIETYQFDAPELEQRYYTLSQELRCPKCQNQNIADSNAPISQDLRKLLHQQLQAGASDEEILDYMVARYGEFVRYRPRFGGVSLLLWAAPAFLLLVGMVIMLLVLRSRKGVDIASATLGADEQARLDQLLEKAERDS